jgi:mannose-6-phosphate isomerase
MDFDTAKIYRLIGKLQAYDWGGKRFIPSLLGINPNGLPYAEYWMGAHDKCSSDVELGENKKIPLRDLIEECPDESLGNYVSLNFHRLPYLLKVLDVMTMLSIQVHPAKKPAEIEFARENIEGITKDDSRRNYKDDNHKPELMVALGDFWLVHGFKTKEKLIEILSKTPELKGLLPVFYESGYHGVYKMVMEMPQEKVNNILQPLLDRITPLYNEKNLKKEDENFWAARAALTFNQPGEIDRGIFSIYFFNLVKLKKREGIFQAAGVPHAYLEGQNVEIMANSDNVLRGGLTTKHIDIDELMKHIRFEETIPDVLQPVGEKNENIYPTPAPDFQLSAFSLDAGQTVSFTTTTTEIIFVLEGNLNIASTQNSLPVKKGGSVVAFANRSIALEAQSTSEVYRATVPINTR